MLKVFCWGRFKGWVWVRGKKIQFVQYKSIMHMEYPHKKCKPTMCVCKCIGVVEWLSEYILEVA